MPWMLAIFVLTTGFRFLTGNPYVDIDDVEPVPAVFQVDINAAEWPEIAQLPGVGETLASRIVAQRTTAPFSSVDQLLAVRGIGEKKMNAIRPFLLPIVPQDSPLTDSSDLAANSVIQNGGKR